MSATGGVFWGADARKQARVLDDEILAFSTPFLFEEDTRIKKRGGEDNKKAAAVTSRAQDELAALMVGGHRDEMQHLEAELAAEEEQATKDKIAAMTKKKPKEEDKTPKDLKAFDFGSTMNVKEGEEYALMATLRALIKIVRKRVLSNDGLPHPMQSMFTAPVGNCDSQYYPSAVQEEDRDYFLQELQKYENSKFQDKKGQQVGWLKKMHYRNAAEKDYPDGYKFDRTYMSSKKKKKMKKMKPEGGVTGELDLLAKPAGASMHSHVGWKDIRARHEIPSTKDNNNDVADSKALNKALKAGQKGNWVELQAGGLENQRKQYEHLLHILQTQLCAEIQRHSDLNSISLEEKRKRYRVHARITRERGEAADWIVRILKKYGMMSALEEASYLTATCKSLLDAQNTQYNSEDAPPPTSRLATSKSAPAGLTVDKPNGREQDAAFVKNLEQRIKRADNRSKERDAKAKRLAKKATQKRSVPGHVIYGSLGKDTMDYTLPKVKHDIYEQRRRRKQGIGRYHTGQQSLLKSHAATEILWKLDEKDQKDVTESGKYSAGRLGGKNLFMQLTNVAPDCNKAYSFTMSQQLDAFTNFGNQNPSTLPPQVPSPPPGSPVGSPRFPPSVFQHAPGFYPDGQQVRFEGYN